MPVNLYGPGDNFDPASSHVIPALIRKFIQANRDGRDEVVVWGSGSASREFLYVEDCARGVTLAAQQYDGDEPVNLGSSFEITIGELAAKISHMTGYKGRIVYDSTKPDGQPRRCLDTQRAANYFGFKAQMDLDQGLRKTIDWTMQQRDLFK
jgi:GDP-L-fucose synthase